MEGFEKQEFQLHHTGIKTKAYPIVDLLEIDFNCTIQELKRKPK